MHKMHIHRPKMYHCFADISRDDGNKNASVTLSFQQQQVSVGPALLGKRLLFLHWEQQQLPTPQTTENENSDGARDSFFAARVSYFSPVSHFRVVLVLCEIPTST